MNLDRPSDASFDDCEHVLERVYEFLDNEIDAATSDAIRRHLAMCEPCLDSSMSRRPSSRWSIGVRRRRRTEPPPNEDRDAADGNRKTL